MMMMMVVMRMMMISPLRIPSITSSYRDDMRMIIITMHPSMICKLETYMKQNNDDDPDAANHHPDEYKPFPCASPFSRILRMLDGVP